MTYDPRTAMLDRDRPPWLENPRAEPCPDAPLSDRGPLERERKILTVNLSQWAARFSRWLGGR